MALDTQSLARRGRQLFRFTHSARLLLVLLLVVLGLFLAWQAMLLRQEDGALKGLISSNQSAAVALAEPVAEAKAKLHAALTDPALVAAAESGDRDAVRSRLAALLPAASGLALLDADPGALLNADERKVGYVRLAQWAHALDGDQEVSVVVDGENTRLSLVQPVNVGDRVAMLAAAYLPFAQVAERFDELSLAPGKFQLRAGNDRGAVLLQHGSGEESAADVTHGIAGSNLWMTATRTRSEALLSSALPYWFVFGLAFAAVFGAAAIGWGRQISGLQQRVSRRGAKDGVEPTFAEVLDREARAPAKGRTEPAAAAKPASAKQEAIAVERSIFRAYDIRGVVGKTLDQSVVKLIGQAIGSEARARGLDEIVVGRDGRLSGPEMAGALIDGLRASGMDVIDIGPAPTPLVYFACFHLNTGSGVAVTGSHNPPDYNGFKIVLGGETLAEGAIQDLYARIAEDRLETGSGQLRKMDVTADYIERVASDVQTERPIKVVVDCGNGIAGAVAPDLLGAIGCEVIPLHAEVDGSFPNHHPDPSDPANLEDLKLSVKHQKAELGIAFDGDGDRLGVIDAKGEIIFPDRLLMLFAIDVLERDPGATILYDVKCTGHLPKVILPRGGRPLMWKTGHSLIKAKMRETGAALAGEMSGHFFFQERWYGFDDGIYAAARLLEILASDPEGRSPTEIFATLPKGVSTPELKIEMAEGETHAFIEKFQAGSDFPDARVSTIDGVRADWPDGWGLVRASNTTPVLVLRFDADNETALKRIKGVFREKLRAVNQDLELPF